MVKNQSQTTVVKTNIALTVTCKCGSTVAATLLYGGITIDEEFTMTIAETYNDGGQIEIINVEEKSVNLRGCQCPTDPL